MPEICIVLAKRQNTFFFEIAEAICDELAVIGQKAWISTHGFPPPREDLVYVLLPPHEYYRLEGLEVEPTLPVLKRTVFICAEQPGTIFFDDDAFLAPRAGAVFDVSQLGIREFKRKGVEAVGHFPLGWTPRWSPATFEHGQTADPRERDVDVLHLGIFSPKRARTLAGAAPWLWHRHAVLMLSDDHGPNVRAQANYATGEGKWELLSRSRVLLNVHVGDRPYFEWQRIVQAIGSGCAIVSEHSVDYEPLVPGTHLSLGRPETLGLLAQELIEDEERRFRIARDAWLFLKEERPFSASVAELAEACEQVNRNPIPSERRTTRFRKSYVAPPAEPEFGADGYPTDVSDRDASVVRAASKEIRLDLMALRRELKRQALREDGGDWPPLVERDMQTKSYAAARPRVSFITALYNHGNHIAAALDSAAQSWFQDIEIVVVDDGSTDESAKAVRSWMARAQDVPALLVRHPVNRGLGAARNTALDFARGELVLVLDSDNEVYPSALTNLLGRLESDPEAVFAYGMLEMFSTQGPVGLRSYFPWRPERFRSGNYIDALALIKRSWLIENGGYTTDLRLHGWEDFDLWCRVAERGGHGVLVPQIVARYRSAAHSMLSLTDISSRMAVSLLVDRHPQLLWGVELPL